MIKGFIYRVIMRLAHKYNWHYAPPVYPEGDVQLWCEWCGFRQTIMKKEIPPLRNCIACKNYKTAICETCSDFDKYILVNSCNNGPKAATMRNA